MGWAVPGGLGSPVRVCRAQSFRRLKLPVALTGSSESCDAGPDPISVSQSVQFSLFDLFNALLSIARGGKIPVALAMFWRMMRFRCSDLKGVAALIKQC